MLKQIRYVVVITIPTLLVLALVLEVAFRIVIPASNPPRGFFDEENLIYRHVAGPSEGVFTIGALAQQRGNWRINNYGWNSPIDYQEPNEQLRVAVIGDSYIEAFQVDVDKNYPALLDSALSCVDVYSFGISGAPLSHYLHMTRYVTRVFDPDVLIINLILNDFFQSIYDGTRPHWLTLRVENGRVEEVPPRTNHAFTQYHPVKQIARKSALVRYLAFNLQLRRTLTALLREKTEFEENTDRTLLRSRLNEVQKVTRYVMTKIRKENPDRKIIFVIDGPKQNIYAGKTPSEEIRFLYEIVAQYSSDTHSVLLNLWPKMRHDYQKNEKKFNSEFDGHWNEYGHAFVFEQVLPLLDGQTKLVC